MTVDTLSDKQFYALLLLMYGVIRLSFLFMPFFIKLKVTNQEIEKNTEINTSDIEKLSNSIEKLTETLIIQEKRNQNVAIRLENHEGRLLHLEIAGKQTIKR